MATRKHWARSANHMMEWLREVGRDDAIWPNGYSFELGLTIEDRINRLIVTSPHETELARFTGSRKHRHTWNDKQQGYGGCLLINGNGFQSTALQGVQNALRERARQVFGMTRNLVIPYDALTGAGINLNSVRRISANGDTWITRRISINTPPPGFHRERVEFQWDERRWRRVGRGQLSVLHQSLNGSRWHTVRNNSITESIHSLGASVFSAVGPDRRRHRYISAFDIQETPGLYFLAQLPPGDYRNYISAIESLAPPIVHEARRKGTEVPRQGDVFFIDTDHTDQTLKKQGARFHERHTRIYGTEHEAERVARLPNGVTFATGVVIHRRIPPDHRPLILRARWFLCVRNTVPRVTSTNGRRVR